MDGALTFFQRIGRSLSGSLTERTPVMRRLTVLCLALALAPGLAAAQPQQCGERERIVQVLSEKYGESRRSIGLTAQGAMVETYASDATGSWTITVTFPAGQMCLLASGQSYVSLADEVVPSGAPA